MTLICQTQHNISKDNDDIADNCIDYDYIDKYCTDKKLSDDYIDSKQNYLMKMCFVLRSTVRWRGLPNN